MATIKAYSDLEQSRKLAEILPLESADMYYMETSYNNYTIGVLQRMERDMLLKQAEYYKMFPCWSLAALLGVIPKHIKDYNVLRIDISTNDFAIWYDEIDCGVNNELPDITKETAIDACVAMIEKLHELKML